MLRADVEVLEPDAVLALARSRTTRTTRPSPPRARRPPPRRRGPADGPRRARSRGRRRLAIDGVRRALVGRQLADQPLDVAGVLRPGRTDGPVRGFIAGRLASGTDTGGRGGAVQNSEILARIDELVAQEHRLRSQGHSLSEEDRATLRDAEVHLDQLWDLMRRRDALAPRRARTRTRPRGSGPPERWSRTSSDAHDAVTRRTAGLRPPRSPTSSRPTRTPTRSTTPSPLGRRRGLELYPAQQEALDRARSPARTSSSRRRPARARAWSRPARTSRPSPRAGGRSTPRRSRRWSRRSSSRCARSSAPSASACSPATPA